MPGEPQHDAGSSKGSRRKSKADLPANLALQRTHMLCGPEMNSHVRTLTLQ
jgi:hypothetical protein